MVFSAIEHILGSVGKKCSPSVFKAVRVKMRKVLNDLKIKVRLVIASKQLS